MASIMRKSVAAIREPDFTEEEVKSEVGKVVCLVADLNGFRQGTIGEVVDFHVEPQSDQFEVVVRFDSKNGSEPIYDLFSRSKYDRFLRDA